MRSKIIRHKAKLPAGENLAGSLQSDVKSGLMCNDLGEEIPCPV